MNIIEKQVFEIVRSKLNLDEERNTFEKLQEENMEKVFDWNLWVSSWGKIDVEIIMKYSIKHGIPPLVFAKEWVEMDEVEKMRIYVCVSGGMK